MVQRVATVAFEGIEARAVDVQVQVAPGLPKFHVVGLPDKAVSEARIIQPGSYLLIESLYRISRDKPRKAFRLLEQICEAGISPSITTADGKRYDEATLDDDPMALMYALMIAIRANEENELKSDRVGRAYADKRKKAATGTENGVPFTRMLPAWLEFDDKETKRIVAIPERERVVFVTSLQESRSGLGAAQDRAMAE